MINASDIIAKVRSRLKDDDYSDLRFSQAEIIDSINAVVSSLISEIKLNKRQKSQNLSETSKFLYLPCVLSIFDIRFNNKYIHSRTDIEKQNGDYELFITDKGVSVTPFCNGFLSVVYNSYEPIQTDNESLPLPEIATDCVVYGVLSLMLEVPLDNENYNKIAFYKQLFKEAKNTLIIYLNNLYSSTQPKSKVVRV